MPIPIALIAAASVSATASILQGLWGVHQTYETTSNSDKAYSYIRDFQKGYRDENTRFWDEYIKRHHLQGREIMYPYRTGYNYDLAKMYTAESNLANNSVYRQGSWVSAFTGGSKSLTSPIPALYR